MGRRDPGQSPDSPGASGGTLRPCRREESRFPRNQFPEEITRDTLRNAPVWWIRDRSFENPIPEPNMPLTDGKDLGEAGGAHWEGRWRPRQRK